MAPTALAPDLAAFPPELIARLVRQVDQDAVLAMHLLKRVGLAPPPGRVREFPPEFLLELGAACRLVIWEVEGLTLHREAGLPSAGEALRRLLLDESGRVTESPGDPPYPPLQRAVLDLTIDVLAWTGPADLGAEILLETPDEDTLVDALACFLWEHRHGPSAGDPGRTP